MAAIPLSPLPAPAVKVCVGCKQTLPADAEHFRINSQSGDGLGATCLECLEDAAARRAAAAQEIEAAARVKAAVRAVRAADEAEAVEQLDSVVASLAGWPPGARADQIEDPTGDGRRDVLRLRIALAPEGGAAEAAAGARQLMAAADDYVSALRARRIDLRSLAAAIAEQPELGGVS